MSEQTETITVNPNQVVGDEVAPSLPMSIEELVNSLPDPEEEIPCETCGKVRKRKSMNQHIGQAHKRKTPPTPKKRGPGRPRGAKNKPKPIVRTTTHEVIESKIHGVHIYLDLNQSKGVVHDDDGNVWIARLIKVEID